MAPACWARSTWRGWWIGRSRTAPGIDEAALADLVAVAVRMMDNVVDASRFPLPQQAEEAQAKRRIGLGVTGLADALLMVGLRYGSEEAARQTEHWLHAHRPRRLSGLGAIWRRKRGRFRCSMPSPTWRAGR